MSQRVQMLGHRTGSSGQGRRVRIAADPGIDGIGVGNRTARVNNRGSNFARIFFGNIQGILRISELNIVQRIAVGKFQTFFAAVHRTLFYRNFISKRIGSLAGVNADNRIDDSRTALAQIGFD